MNNFDNTINTALEEDWKSAVAGGLMGIGAMTGGAPDAEAKQPQQITQQSNAFIHDAFKYIKGKEGIRLKPYRDTPTSFAIGFGHKILPGEDFSNGITEEEANKLFYNDIKAKLRVARRLFHNFDTYPDYLKIALLDGTYRGEHKSRYKTTKHINNGDFIEAAKEYLKNNEYYNSKSKGTGVYKRMDKNSKAMEKFGREQA